MLTAENICKKYGGLFILQDVSISAREGEIVGIIGRNGCGKSTLLSILGGVEKADSGRITGSGMTGYLPQINPLIEEATVTENLSLWVRDRKTLQAVIADYDLEGIKKRRVSKLSGGMKRRLAIACIMANRPQVLIMDEPTTALDIEYKRIIHQEMMSFVHSGNSIILVTHEKEEIEMCDRVFRLEDGKLSLILAREESNNGK